MGSQLPATDLAVGGVRYFGFPTPCHGPCCRRRWVLFVPYSLPRTLLSAELGTFCSQLPATDPAVGGDGYFLFLTPCHGPCCRRRWVLFVPYSLPRTLLSAEMGTLGSQLPATDPAVGGVRYFLFPTPCHGPCCRRRWVLFVPYSLPRTPLSAEMGTLGSQLPATYPAVGGDGYFGLPTPCHGPRCRRS